MTDSPGVDSFFGCTNSALNCHYREFSTETDVVHRVHSHLRTNVWSSDDVVVARRIVRGHHRISTISDGTTTSSGTRCMENSGVGGGGPQRSFSSPTPSPPNIPKHIHFIWLGPKSIPPYPDLFTTPPSSSSMTRKEDDGHDQEERLRWNGTMRSWKTYHDARNGWSLQLWTESSIRAFHQSTPPSSRSIDILRQAYGYALSIKNYGMASDIARLELLYGYGGLYVDIDYYCFHPFDDLHNGHIGAVEGAGKQIDFYCGASNTGCIEVNNGLIGCTKGHRLIHKMMENIASWWSTSIYSPTARSAGQYDGDGRSTATSCALSSFLDADSLLSFTQATRPTAMDVIENTGPGLLTRTVFEQFRVVSQVNSSSSSLSVAPSLLVFPSATFHPLPNNARMDLRIDCEKGGGAKEDRYRRILQQYLIPGKTRSAHLWGCSWCNDKI